MNDADFKIKMCEDVGYIKAKVENLEKIYQPCEKVAVKERLSKVETKLEKMPGKVWSILVSTVLITIAIIGVYQTSAYERKKQVDKTLKLGQNEVREPQIPTKTKKWR